MKIYSLAKERKDVVKAFSEKLGVKSEYLGSPTFSYRIGPYTIVRDGSIEVKDGEENKEVLRELHLKGLIDDSWDDEREVLDIRLPIEGHDGRTLSNLSRIIFCRSNIINRAIGCAGAFVVSERFIEALEEKPPLTIYEFLSLLEEKGGNNVNVGIEFYEDGIHFMGFPISEDADVIKAYMDLTALVNHMALTQKRVQLEIPDIKNEKYSFRVWLLRLGMSGDKYKDTRKVLLNKLSGHSAFRTKEAEEKAKDKIKAMRVAAKKV